ncbi:MAG: NADP-dependent phosphogluconate dehydrogenase, partial [Planctomycetota bacterium]
MSTALLAIAARAPNTNEPCVVYCGSGGAGNYVKMVHNGIEYGDMQLIGEVFAMFKAKGMENAEIAAIFERWNSPDHALRSFLVEITSKVLLKEEMKVVLDKAGSKGTGKWTVQEAAQLGVPAPTVSAALEARYVSSLKDLRVEAGTIPTNTDFLPDEDLETMLSDALVCSKICSYAQGLSLICEAKKVHGWTDLQLTNVLDCWRGGCIIRAKLIGDFRAAVLDQTDDARFNLLAAPSIDSLLTDRQRN